MAHHEAGRLLPSDSMGDERESLIREFLANVFPPPFRFGTGSVIDHEDRNSGEVDIVVEFPFLPSFPTPGVDERLYLADSTALVIDVKSDLSKGWPDVRRKAKAVLPMRRTWLAHFAVDHEGKRQELLGTVSCIPFLSVGYKGPKDVTQKLADTPEDERPHGVLVIESGAYSGCCWNGCVGKGIGAAGILNFALDIGWLASNVKWAAPNLKPYFEIGTSWHSDTVR